MTAACGSGGPTPTEWSSEQRWSSAHFVYHARPDDDTVSAPVLDDLEKDATLVASGLLGLSPDAWGPVHYFKYRNLRDLVAAGTGCNDRPCTLLFDSGRIEIHSPQTIDQHELVHAYDLPISCAPPLFREGLATSIGCSPVVESVGNSDTDEHPSWLDGSWRDITDFSSQEAIAYAPAGVLVTWLVDQFGLAAFLGFYRALGCASSQDEIATIFQAHFGVSLDSVWSDLVAAPRRRLCLSTWACAESDVTGSLALSNQVADYRLAAPIPSTGAQINATYSGSDMLPVVRPCTPDGAMPGFDGYWPQYPDGFYPTLVVPGSTRNVIALRDFGTADDPSARFDLTITPFEASPTPASCSDVRPITVDQQQASALIWPQQSPVILHIQSSAVADTVTTRVRSYAGPGDTTLETCSDCVGGVLQNCQPSLAIDSANAPWVRVEWAPAVFAPLAFSIQWQ